MRRPFKLSNVRIRTKLLAIIALIITVFIMIVLTVLISFQRIENVLGGVLAGDMQNVITNALMERELSSIAADINLLLSTFFEDEAHLKSEGQRLLEVPRGVVRRTNGGDMDASLRLFAQRLEFLLEQCQAVNRALRRLSAADRHLVSAIDGLEEVIADKLIDAALVGDDTSILKQLSILAVGYRQSLLEIGKLHAQRWPETYYTTLEMDRDPLLAAIDELNLRLRTLMASDPQIANMGREIISNLQTYKAALLALNAVTVELKNCILAVENAKFQSTGIMQKLDKDVVHAVNAANTKVLGTLRVAEASLMAISMALIAALILLTTFFFKSIIKKPMDDICNGIKAFRRGNLDARINLNRSDEWHLIEDALNTMAADLSTSYADLKKAQSLVANFIDSMPSVLVGVDREGRVTQWNRRAKRLTGLSFEAVQSQPLAEVFPCLKNQMNRIWTSIRDRRVIRDLKVPRKDKDETRFEDITIYPLMADGVEGAVIRVDDVTERVRLEEMMIQSEKMLSVGGLAAGMAHEINNPLAGILQNMAVLENRLLGDLPANHKAAQAAGTSLAIIQAYSEKRNLAVMLENIRVSGKRAATIVKNMLSFAHKSDRMISSHDLCTLLDQTLELAQTDYDMKKRYDFKQIRIVREYDRSVPIIPCESSKLQQVFLNILKNGAEAMASETRPAMFTLRVNGEGDWITVEIEDNGPGMNDATRRRIFEPFFTTKPVGQGTGLGLSVSYFIITENHGGEMDAHAVDTGGTRFVIRLPKSRKAAA
ncbi:two component system sensor histidine kinase [Desulfosarcina variabilis str. Montpellier]|uniref:ATP-binding protein n=1 Tax=Desulfosarcina variabilis TaxID=2300 RepID=UPI003AFB695C